MIFFTKVTSVTNATEITEITLATSITSGYNEPVSEKNDLKVIRVKPEVHRALKVWAVQAGMTLNEAAEALILHGVGVFPATGAGKAGQEPTWETGREASDYQHPVAGSSPAPPVKPGELPDGRWRLEGPYNYPAYTNPIWRKVRDGETRWLDDNGYDVDDATVAEIEEDLGREKPNLKLREVKS